MDNLKDDNRCFACGKDNPIGLNLNFKSANGEAISAVVFTRDFEGWDGIVHGGIVSTVLDEVMVKSAGINGYRCVTAEIKIKFKRPCFSGERYVLKGRIKELRKRIIITEGEIVDKKGDAIATGSGKLFIIENQ